MSARAGFDGQELARLALLTLLLSAACSSAFALNPTLDVNQYAHTAWKIRDGFTRGIIRSISQTQDGYLWLGTEFGLLRFDGVRAVEWRPPAGQPLPSTDIWSVLAARDGALWIGTAKGLVRWKAGQVTSYRELSGRIVWRLLEDRENTVWASASGVPSGRLCAIRDRQLTCDGDDGRFGLGVLGMHEDRQGNLWLGVAGGIWRWRPGPPTFFALPDEPEMIQGFGEPSDGQLLVTTHRGIRRFVAGAVGAFVMGGTTERVDASNMLHDRDGALWATTSTGVVHAHQGRVDAFGQVDGLSGAAALALFEDREGSIWVSTADGLDRFRDPAVWTLTDKQGLSDGLASSVRTARDGSVWVGTRYGVQRRENGRVTSYRAPARTGVAGRNEVVPRGFPEGTVGALLADRSGRIWVANPTAGAVGYLDGNRYVPVSGVSVRFVRSMVEDTSGNVWVADQAAGLLQIAHDGRVEQHRWRALGHDDFVTATTADPARGGVWLGFWAGGIGRFHDGKLRETYTEANGLGGGRVANLRFDTDGSLWVATERGLSHVRNGRAATLTTSNGLPCNSVHWVMDDDTGSLWLNTACGLVRLQRGDVGAALADSRHRISATVIDSADGLRLSGTPTGYDPFVDRSPDGQIWFAGPSLQIFDPRHLPSNRVKPPVHIERIVADRRAFDVPAGAGSRVSLPALTRDLEIDYTALSLVDPDRNRFRYRLDGYDRDWQDAGNRRQAFYTNLAPGAYRFRVIASNNSGVWNETGATVDFAIAPTFYQTTWFWALSAGLVAAAVWGAHRVRLRIVEAHQREITALNERLMKAQEQERMRIAGELHDGVAQEMLAVTMMVGTARRRIPADSPAMATLDKMQDKMIQLGTDIRQISHDLHPPVLQEAGLPEALRSYCDEFGATSGIAITCEADESARELSRGAALALYRILQEALGNAAKHAQPKRVAVRLMRSNGAVTLTVSDDGAGFDRGRLDRAGGLGLVTMRERASQLNGTFDFESAPDRGTTIRVTIPFR